MLFCSLGLIGGVSQYWTTQALYYAPAAAVSPFNYMALIWGSVLGFVVWGEVPTMAVTIGAAVVTLSGLYLLRHEAFRRAPTRRAPARRAEPALKAACPHRLSISVDFVPVLPHTAAP